MTSILFEWDTPSNNSTAMGNLVLCVFSICQQFFSCLRGAPSKTLSDILQCFLKTKPKYLLKQQRVETLGSSIPLFYSPSEMKLFSMCLGAATFLPLTVSSVILYSSLFSSDPTALFMSFTFFSNISPASLSFSPSYFIPLYSLLFFPSLLLHSRFMCFFPSLCCSLHLCCQISAGMLPKPVSTETCPLLKHHSSVLALGLIQATKLN